MPGADESASSMTTASFGSISPIACSSASGCIGTAPASARAFALSASRSAAMACVARASRTRAAAHAFANRSGEIGQRRLGIAENGDRGGIVLAELPGVHIQMDELEVSRHGVDVGRKGERKKIAADREQGVIGAERLSHL